NIHILETNLRVRSETLLGALNRTLRHRTAVPSPDIAALEDRLREYVDADRTLTRLDILQSNGGSSSLLATSSDRRVPATQSIPTGLSTSIENLAGERIMVTSAPL